MKSSKPELPTQLKTEKSLSHIVLPVAARFGGRIASIAFAPTCDPTQAKKPEAVAVSAGPAKDVAFCHRLGIGLVYSLCLGISCTLSMYSIIARVAPVFSLNTR